MDLEKLKIDRPQETVVPRRQGRSPRLGPWILVGCIATALWVFKQPLLRFADRFRLETIEVFEVARPSRMAASAVRGISANGYVVARNRAALSADTPGRVIEMNVEEGSVVRRGDVVARLFADELSAALRIAEGELQAAELLVDTRTEQVLAFESELDLSRSALEEATARVEEARARVGLARLQEERAERLVAQDVQSQQALDEARAELDQSEASLEATQAAQESARRAIVQAERNLAVGRANAKEAEAGVEVRKAARDQARATLGKTEVRAPFDGVVILKDAEIGEVVNPNAQGGSSSRGSVITMVDFDSLEVQVEVPETSVSSVRIGAAASIYLDAYPEHLYQGKVERIFPTANRQKATIEVRVTFDRRDERLRPDMGVRVVFTPPGEAGEAAEEAPASGEAATSPEVVLVPGTCVVKIDGRQGVFILERDVVHWRPVETGPRKGERIAILSGLQEGDRVALAPPASLQDRDRVLIEE